MFYRERERERETARDPYSSQQGCTGLEADVASRCSTLRNQTAELEMVVCVQYVGITVWHEAETCQVKIREAKGNRALHSGFMFSLHGCSLLLLPLLLLLFLLLLLLQRSSFVPRMQTLERMLASCGLCTKSALKWIYHARCTQETRRYAHNCG